MTEKKLNEVIDRLRENYGTPKARKEGDKIWSLIKVILSQNTNDKNRDRAYSSLFKKYDQPEQLLRANESEIAEAISTAGLHNKKAKRIKKSLEKINQKRGEVSLDFLEEKSLSEARSWLLDLPGIGPKSAAVILNFDLNKKAFPVDTHVFRVTKRLGLIPRDSSRGRAHELLEDMTPSERMEEFHLNLIRHGREVCKAPTPVCSECFLNDLCEYYEENFVDIK